VAEAQGEYIFFVDADDTLIPGGTAKILDKALKTSQLPDIILFDRHFILNKSPQKEFPSLSTNIYFEGKIRDFLLRHGIRAFVTSFFFKREIIRDLKFNSFKVGEDLSYMLEIYDNINLNILAFDSKLYVYNVNNASAVHRNSKENVTGLVLNYIDIYKLLRQGSKLTNYTLSERMRLVNYDINYFCFAKIMSAPFSLKETKEILHKCSEVGLFDFDWLYSRFYNTLRYIAKHPMLFWSLSPLYRYIYIPFFKKG